MAAIGIMVASSRIVAGSSPMAEAIPAVAVTSAVAAIAGMLMTPISPAILGILLIATIAYGFVLDFVKPNFRSFKVARAGKPRKCWGSQQHFEFVVLNFWDFQTKYEDFS